MRSRRSQKLRSRLLNTLRPGIEVRTIHMLASDPHPAGVPKPDHLKKFGQELPLRMEFADPLAEHKTVQLLRAQIWCRLEISAGYSIFRKGKISSKKIVFL